MTEQMYRLEREGRDVDYIHAKGGNILVTSDMFKLVWEDPDKCYPFPDYNTYTYQTYYGMDKDDVLKDAELIWER